MADLPPLTDEEFKQLQEYLKEEKRKREENRPSPQGDYQWEGGYVMNGGFGMYQPLYYKGKMIGGLFAASTRFPNEYHRFSPDGGVYPEKSSPPVELRPVPGGD